MTPTSTPRRARPRAAGSNGQPAKQADVILSRAKGIIAPPAPCRGLPALHTLVAASLSFLAALPPAAADPLQHKYAGLLNNSPFGAPPANTIAASAAGHPLEFRGVVVEDSSNFFSIYDPTSRRSVWAELNKPVNGFTVQRYDGAHESVTVSYQGKLLTLSLKRAFVVAQAGPLVPAGINPQPNSPGDTIGAPGAPQSRQLVDEGIRRRRAARAQAAENANPRPLPPDPQPVSADPQPEPAET